MFKMLLTSPAFIHNSSIPVKYTCQSEEINPPLEISGVPDTAKSLVLIMEDPDTPIKITVTHWIVFNLDPNIKKIEEGSKFDNAIVGKNLIRRNSYLGPCPPWGEHRYVFTLYALDTILNLPKNTNKKQLLKTMKNHILEQTQLVGYYSKVKK